jgi:hypothetical protein
MSEVMVAPGRGGCFGLGRGPVVYARKPGYVALSPKRWGTLRYRLDGGIRCAIPLYDPTTFLRPYDFSGGGCAVSSSTPNILCNRNQPAGGLKIGINQKYSGLREPLPEALFQVIRVSCTRRS